MNKEKLEKRLLKVLEEEPAGYGINDLSEKVIHKIQARDKAEQRGIAIFYFLALGGFLLLSAGGLIYFLGLEKIREMQDIFLTGLFIVGLVMIIQWLDYKLVKRKKSLATGSIDN